MKYIILIVVGVVLIFIVILLNQQIQGTFRKIEVMNTVKMKVITADGYEPDIVVVSMEDSLYHLPRCGWKGDNPIYMLPDSVIVKGFSPCPHCFLDE